MTRTQLKKVLKDLPSEARMFASDDPDAVLDRVVPGGVDELREDDGKYWDLREVVEDWGR